MIFSLVSASSAQAASALYHGSMNGQAGFGVSVPIKGFLQPGATSPPGCLMSVGAANGNACDIRGVGMAGPEAGAPAVAALMGTGPAGFTIPVSDFDVQTTYMRSAATLTPPVFQSSSAVTVANGIWANVSALHAAAPFRLRKV